MVTSTFAIVRLHLQIARNVFQVNVLGAGHHPAGTGKVAAPNLVAGNLDVAGHGSNLHVGARSLEGHGLGDLAEANVVVEIAIQMYRSGNLIDGDVVDMAVHVHIAGDLGSAQRTFLQTDLSRTRNVAEFDIAILQSDLDVGLAFRDGHIAALAGDIEGGIGEAQRCPYRTPRRDRRRRWYWR